MVSFNFAICWFRECICVSTIWFWCKMLWVMSIIWINVWFWLFCTNLFILNLMYFAFYSLVSNISMICFSWSSLFIDKMSEMLFNGDSLPPLPPSLKVLNIFSLNSLFIFSWLCKFTCFILYLFYFDRSPQSPLKHPLSLALSFKSSRFIFSMADRNSTRKWSFTYSILFWEHEMMHWFRLVVMGVVKYYSSSYLLYLSMHVSHKLAWNAMNRNRIARQVSSI